LQQSTPVASPNIIGFALQSRSSAADVRTEQSSSPNASDELCVAGDAALQVDRCVIIATASL
jgi:hypothetical protein